MWLYSYVIVLYGHMNLYVPLAEHNISREMPYNVIAAPTSGLYSRVVLVYLA